MAMTTVADYLLSCLVKLVKIYSFYSFFSILPVILILVNKRLSLPARRPVTDRQQRSSQCACVLSSSLTSPMVS